MQHSTRILPSKSESIRPQNPEPLRQALTRLLLLILVVFGFQSQAYSQAKLTGLWEFDDPNNTAKATVGKDLVFQGIPPGWASDSVDDHGTNIKGALTTPSPARENTIHCPHGISPKRGQKYVNKYSIVADIFSPKKSRNAWRSIFQTKQANTDDGDYFIKTENNTMGTTALGYSTAEIDETKWTRLVLTFDLTSRGGDAVAYIDGKLFHRHSSDLDINGRYSLGTGLKLFADDSGDNAQISVNAFAIYDGILTAKEVAALGKAGAPIVARKGDKKGAGSAHDNVIAIDIKSNDGGSNLTGTMTYSGEGPIGFRGNLRGHESGDNVAVMNQWGGPDAPWHKTGRWVIGARDNQHIVAMKAKSTDNGKTLEGTMTYSNEGYIRARAKRTNGVVYHVDNQYSGSWNDGGAWVLGTRRHRKQYLVGIDIASKDDGKTFVGTVTYDGEGPIGFRASQLGGGKDLTQEGNGYKVEVQWGGGDSRWQTKGMWIIGGRHQRAVKVSARSTDGGKTLVGTMKYVGEGAVGFRAKMSGGRAYQVSNQWGDSDSKWNIGGLFVLGSRPRKPAEKK